MLAYATAQKQSSDNDQDTDKQSTSTEEENGSDKEMGSFLDRMQNEKIRNTQSIEILHRRRPTREQLMEKGIIKPEMEVNGLGIVVEDILDDIKQNEIETELKNAKSKSKKKKRKKQKQNRHTHTKDPSFAPAIIDDDRGQAWDIPGHSNWDNFKKTKAEKRRKKRRSSKGSKSSKNSKHSKHSKNSKKSKESKEKSPKQSMGTDTVTNVENEPLTLTLNNVRAHNKLYSINGQFVINKFLDFEENNQIQSNAVPKFSAVKSAKINKKIVKTQSKRVVNRIVKPKIIRSKSSDRSKVTRNKSKKLLKKTQTPKLAKRRESRVVLAVNKDLKQWMLKNSVWDNGLYSYLTLNGVLSLESVCGLKQSKFDQIIRQFRSEKFAKIRNKKTRNHIDKILIKFEKSWRKLRKQKKKKKKRK